MCLCEECHRRNSQSIVWRCLINVYYVKICMIGLCKNMVIFSLFSLRLLIGRNSAGVGSARRQKGMIGHLEVNVGADIVFFWAVADMMVVLASTCHHSVVILWRLLGWDSTDLEQRVKATLFHHSNDRHPTYRSGKGMRDEGSSLVYFHNKDQWFFPTGL